METPASRYPRTANGRPRMPQRNSPLEWVCIVLAFAGVVASSVILVVWWSRVPAIVPTHFGADGKPNAYGDKVTFLILPVITLVFVSLITWIAGKPHLFNFPWKITDENAARQYRAARVLMRLLTIELAWTFAYLTYASVQVALGNSTGLDAAFLVIALIAVFGTILGYIVVALRLR